MADLEQSRRAEGGVESLLLTLSVILAICVVPLAARATYLFFTRYSRVEAVSTRIAPKTDQTPYHLHIPGPAGSGPEIKIAIVTHLTASIQNMYHAFIKEMRENALVPCEIRLYETTLDTIFSYSLIEEALEWGADVLVTYSTLTSQLAKEVREKRKSKVPQVFGGTGCPLRAGLIERVDRPGNNITGASVTGYTWVEEMVKKLTLFFPRMERILMPYNPPGLGGALDAVAALFVEQFEARGIAVTPIQIYKQTEISELLSRFTPGEFDLVMLLPDGMMIDSMPTLGRLGVALQAPVYICFNVGEVRSGAAMAYGYTERDAGKAAAAKVNEVIAKGLDYDAGLLPVDTLITAYKAVVNLSNGRAQGMMRAIDTDILYLLRCGKRISPHRVKRVVA